MISTADFQNGTVFEHENAIYEVVWFQHHKPGKGGAVMRVKLRNFNTGSTIERTFKSGEKFRDVPVARQKKQFLYSENGTYNFMDMVTFEQVALPEKTLGETAKFLTENLEVNAVYVDDKLLAIELPSSVCLKVAGTVPGVKGDSVSNIMKPATMENGTEAQVPLFVQEGDTVRIDTRTGQYVERVTV